ncbi:unnamed protein product [Effrenium voratum]|nr:unnamed protein product [Effrenium voratum]
MNARDGPRPQKKQGWECPAPSVEDWADYKQWLQQQERKDELPAAPQIFLADIGLLFHQDPEVKLPWIHRVKCELPRRVGRLAGELPVRASYIGCARDEPEEGFEVFKEAMAEIGIILCRHIHHPPSRFELAHLEQSDLVLVDRGARHRLWETLGTDMGGNEVAEHVKWRYLQGAVIIAVGEAMSMLGEKSWYCSTVDSSVIPFKGWGIFPHIVAEEEGQDLESLVEQLGGAGVVILGIHRGGGMIFNKDGLVEPAKQMVQEYRWDWQSSSVKQALLLGPPRNTGLLCPLYAASQRMGEEEGLEDAYSYALTMEEEQEEEHFISKFDPFDQWLEPQVKQDVEALKRQGNEAFKAKRADLALVHYGQAKVLLASSSKHWTDLDVAFRKAFEEKQPQEAKLGKKEDYQASTLRLSLELNICASSLLAHSQDLERRKSTEAEPNEPAPDPGDQTADSTMLVEVKDNLVVAFRAANEALQLSTARSAKAWFRRAAAFEQMRDYRNALLDLEEALLREPGDKAIAKKRNEMRDLAGTVAENMYYARHKELDLQEQRLNLATRCALHLRGLLGSDTYEDKSAQFAVQQPLARVVESTLEELDGRPQLSEGLTASDAPYLHTHALWTWEFMVQRSPCLRILCIEDVDLGSGPLEWLCKGLRSHKEIQALHFTGVHLGPSGAKMMRNVLAQNTSLIEVKLDSCGLLDSGLAEVSEGLKDHLGQLEFLSLRRNLLTSKKLGKLAAALCREDPFLALGELDLSENPLGAAGCKELAKVLSSSEHKLRVLRLKDCQVDLTGFWRLVSNLDNDRSLSQLDLRVNPLGRGTRRCWRGTMAPNIRCEVLLSDHPLKALRSQVVEEQTASFPLPRWWV